MNFTERVKHLVDGAIILGEWLGESHAAVDKQLAQARTDVCLKCPHNVAPDKLTESVSTAIRKHIEVKNHLQLRTDGEKQLGMCDLCGCPLKTKVWIGIDVIRRRMNQSEGSALPLNCWQKNEP